MHAGELPPPSVAIIIPVYNVERWLPDCLDSIQQQDYPDWRGVIVIDGSPDGSEAIARRYAETDDRFTLVSVPNGGLGSARNVGLEHSRSDYVFFVDSDDTVPEGTISALVEVAERTQSPVVSGYAEDFGETWIPSRYWTQRGPLYWGREVTSSVAESPALLDDHVVWNKLYRRSFLDEHDLRFPARVHCEDMVFSARAAMLAPSVTVKPRLVYRHRRHDQAISASYTRSRTFADWLGQSTITIEAIRESAPAAALRHYLVRFVKTQWWTRARGIHEVQDRELLDGMRTLSVLISTALDPAGRKQLGAWHAACLEMFADGDPTLLAAVDDRLPDGSLADDAGRTVAEAEAILELADRLSEAGGASRRFADALVVGRVLQAVADGSLPSDSEIARRAADASERTSDEYLGAIVGPEGDHADRVQRFLLAHGRMSSLIHGVRRERRGIVLRGTLTPTIGVRRADRITAIISPAGEGGRAFVPVTWTVLSDEQEWRWQAAIPVSEITADMPYSIVLKAEERGEQRGRSTAQSVADGLDHLVRDRTSIVFRRSLLRSNAQARHLSTFPAWQDNPYVVALQLELFARRFVMTGTSDLEVFVDELSSPFRSGVVHVQWPSVITDQAVSENDAERRVDAFLNALRTAKILGRPIVWTVHNVLPHDTEYVAQAVRLHRELADIADVIHVLNSRTVQVAAPHYRIDEEKVVTIPHASYDGVYGPPLAPAEARARIGAAADTTTVLFFGQLRPYKGLDRLVDAMASLSGRRNDLELLLAGKPFPGLDEVLSALDATELRSTRSIGFVPDEVVPEWFSAADLLVLPHLKVLNSGTLYLGATFGTPTILPDEEHLRADFGDQQWIRFFDPENAEDSIAALIDDDWYRSPEVRRAAREFARANPPIMMSRRFAHVVEALHEGRAIPRG
ncbi:glycosyltransferase [Leucobacter iarius]|uniref:Glycosyltransferase n=1 Tax=Leucobacter iarius TaxID=333963 RepID=A0ABN2LAA8_9MICO